MDPLKLKVPWHLSRADFTRFQCSIFFNPVTIVNTALFVLNFLNLPQGDILTKEKIVSKHWRIDTSLPLPIWYQDRLTKQWKSGKSILQEKGYASISLDGPNKISWLPLRKIHPRGATVFQNREETGKSPGGGVSSISHGDLKNFQDTPHSRSSILWSPYLGTDKNPY